MIIPKKKKRSQDYDVTDGNWFVVPQEQIDAEIRARKLIEFEDTGKTLDELLKDFNKYTNGLIYALTRKKMPRNEQKQKDIDFLVDYLRPSREFRKAFAFELTERKRTTFYNRAHSIIELAEDFMNAIDKAENKK